jgi:hypothetical protein
MVKKKCGTVCCDETASSSVAKVQEEVFAHFHAVAVRRNSSACQDELFVNNTLDEKKMMSMLLTFLSTCLAFFGLGECGLSVYGSCFLPRTHVYSRPGSS